MFIFELFESKGKHASFCFGRMNPPTLGHAQVFETLKSLGGDYFIFVSQSQDPKKNPLDYATKIKFLRQMFPKEAKHIINDPSINTALVAATRLYNEGYKSVTFVAGSDRMSSFQKLLTDYNGVDGKAHGFYKFDTINFKSSGERDPDADGLEGISASKAREAAKNGDIETFAARTGAGNLAEPLYHAVRKGMNIEENTNRDLIQHMESVQKEVNKLKEEIDSIRTAMQEEAAGVGVIAKKSQTKDPRYSMSITKDVRPGEIKRQLRKFSL